MLQCKTDVKYRNNSVRDDLKGDGESGTPQCVFSFKFQLPRRDIGASDLGIAIGKNAELDLKYLHGSQVKPCQTANTDFQSSRKRKLNFKLRARTKTL
jgi:hypothetical protein